jgi:hypothetical protein
MTASLLRGQGIEVFAERGPHKESPANSPEGLFKNGFKRANESIGTTGFTPGHASPFDCDTSSLMGQVRSHQ